MMPILAPRNEPLVHNRGGLSFLVPSPPPGNSLRNASALQFGLWDRAFHTESPRSEGDYFYNEAPDADHFCGADLRRFHIALHDSALTAPTVQVAWKTLHDDNREFDDNDGAPQITLKRQPSGRYLSEALLLVSDYQDQLAAPFSTITGATRALGDPDHRTRRGSMFGSVLVQYPLNQPTDEARIPIFSRTPDVRKRLQVEIIVLDYHARHPSLGVMATPETLLEHVRAARDIYERIGIWIQPVGRPDRRPSDTLADGSLYTVMPAPFFTPEGQWTVDNSLEFASRLGPLPANTVRATYVKELDGAGEVGDSYPDIPFGPPRAGHLFVTLAAGVATLAHEIGHILLNMTATESHFNTAQIMPIGRPERYRRSNNLMYGGSPSNNATDYLARKRIWDVSIQSSYDPVAARHGHGESLPPTQLARMLASRYLR